jgi:acyl-CoA thioester hydrolase|tara:strand:- start:548 stop:952 length:405 start_codon:yes stop_codon:yes gene_type:complete
MKKFPVMREFVVHWGDMDALGHVNNTRHLRWMETVRVDLFQMLEMRVEESSSQGPILASLKIDYHKPVFYPGNVTVGTRIAHIGNSSFKMENVVYDDEGDLCASGECTIVLFDFEASKSIKISDEMRELIGNYN